MKNFSPVRFVAFFLMSGGKSYDETHCTIRKNIR